MFFCTRLFYIVECTCRKGKYLHIFRPFRNGFNSNLVCRFHYTGGRVEWYCAVTCNCKSWRCISICILSKLCLNLNMKRNRDKSFTFLELSSRREHIQDCWVVSIVAVVILMFFKQSDSRGNYQFIFNLRGIFHCSFHSLEDLYKRSDLSILFMVIFISRYENGHKWEDCFLKSKVIEHLMARLRSFSFWTRLMRYWSPWSKKTSWVFFSGQVSEEWQISICIFYLIALEKWTLILTEILQMCFWNVIKNISQCSLCIKNPGRFIVSLWWGFCSSVCAVVMGWMSKHILNPAHKGFCFPLPPISVCSSGASV